MSVIKGKKIIFLKERGIENGLVYRGILELMGRFGYVSMEEVIYGFDLSEQEARDRLKYLIRQGFIKSFQSFAHPLYFYYLKSSGMTAVRSLGISDEINEFDPKRYKPFYQNHDRTVVRIFCALKKMVGPDFQGWLSERTLRKGESLKFIMEAYRERRVLDGLFRIGVHKKKYAPDPQGELVFQGSVIEPWWCGLELELSIKSKARYQKQFKALSECIYDRINEKQIIPLMFFLCASTTIQDTLIKYQQERTENYGRCVFVFGEVKSFLRDGENAVFVRYIGNRHDEIIGRDFNSIKMKVTA